MITLSFLYIIELVTTTYIVMIILYLCDDDDKPDLFPTTTRSNDFLFVFVYATGCLIKTVRL